MAQKKQDIFIENLEKSVSEKQSHDSWAFTYEEDVRSVNYQAPKLLAKTALELIANGNYLDLGCGTGLVGEAIVQRQIEGIHIDGSIASERC